MLTSRIVLVGVGAVLIGLAAWMGAATPWGVSPLTPASLIIVLPAFTVAATVGESAVWVLIPLLPALAFIAFSNHLLRGSSSIPFASRALFAALVAGSGVWFSIAWSSGVQYQGVSYVVTCLAANVIAAAIVGALLLLHHQKPTWLRAYAFHTAMFLWLGWLSFPWLGEMI